MRCGAGGALSISLLGSRSLARRGWVVRQNEIQPHLCRSFVSEVQRRHAHLERIAELVEILPVACGMHGAPIMAVLDVPAVEFLVVLRRQHSGW